MFSKISEVPVPQENIEEQWESAKKYENLANLAEKREVVKLEQDDVFFWISHPEKTERFADYYGWKLHISVHPEDIQKAFDLAAPIISQYCYSFKVLNNAQQEEIDKDIRLSVGTQTTIYLEKNGEPAITAEQAKEMVEKINQLFLDNNIRTGKKPDSDTETISPYFSMRNDKIKSILNKDRDKTGYIPAKDVGENFNPFNNPNPFYILLNSNKKPFDPLQHFQSFNTNDKNFDFVCTSFYMTLFAYIREYTLIDEMNKESAKEFELQCLEYGESLDAKFLKEAYKENLEIKMAIKQAISILTYISRSNLSCKYPYDNSFKQLLITLENFSKDFYSNLSYFEKSNLCDERKEVANQWKNAAETKIDNLINNLPDEEKKESLIEFVQKGNFFDSQAALQNLKQYCEKQEYIKILHENEALPAAQLELAEIYQHDYQAKSYGLVANAEKTDEYLLRALLSEASNFIEPKGEHIEFFIKHKNLEELQKLDKSGNIIATTVLALIYSRDLPDPHFNVKKFSDAPIDHKLAKECLKKLESNIKYAMAAAVINEELNKFENSPSSSQTITNKL